jgi:hypothetical protein
MRSSSQVRPCPQILCRLDDALADYSAAIRLVPGACAASLCARGQLRQVVVRQTVFLNSLLFCADVLTCHVNIGPLAYLGRLGTVGLSACWLHSQRLAILTSLAVV